MRYLVIEVRPDEGNKVIYVYDNKATAATSATNLNRLGDFSYTVESLSLSEYQCFATKGVY